VEEYQAALLPWRRRRRRRRRSIWRILLSLEDTAGVVDGNVDVNKSNDTQSFTHSRL
jgi:hypothetical protein